MIELLRTRRSIRKFTPEPVDRALVDQVVEAVLRAPSSRGRRPWEFVVVDDRSLLASLSRAKPHGASFLAGAPVGIVVCGDERRSDVWVEDCSIAAFIAHAAAHGLGLGSCWIQLRLRPHDDEQSAEQYVRGLLAIADPLRVHSIVALGHPAESKPGHELGSLDRCKIHWNRFGEP
ncbi:MAG: nitroreductase family protein [Deltaproteobacteria bacterium]|jgi:nitroreductase|nr:nitroreductase family protein [Deltaproteobacteria bacterium]MBW2533694.1 nitroreductase family protein [Deltaproteobacteria bacterium]